MKNDIENARKFLRPLILSKGATVTESGDVINETVDGYNNAMSVIEREAPRLVAYAKEVSAVSKPDMKLLDAIDKIANPVIYLQKEAKKEGAEFNGAMAMMIVNDPNWSREIAKKALSEYLSSAPENKEKDDEQMREIEKLKKDREKMIFMIDHGLGWKDMENDIEYPHEL